MPENTISILTPSVNNLTVRIFLRAAGLEFEEVDVWGKKGTPEFLATPRIRPGGRWSTARCST
jgi:glutathione S-transferase